MSMGHSMQWQLLNKDQSAKSLCVTMEYWYLCLWFHHSRLDLSRIVHCAIDICKLNASDSEKQQIKTMIGMRNIQAQYWTRSWNAYRCSRVVWAAMRLYSSQQLRFACMLYKMWNVLLSQISCSLSASLMCLQLKIHMKSLAALASPCCSSEKEGG